MVLSPDNRVIAIGPPNSDWTNNAQPYGIFTSTRTIDVGPAELTFPDSSVIRVTPGFGVAAFQISEGGNQWWTEPFFVELSEQVVWQRIPRVNLVAVALMPNVGCQMDVVVDRT